MKAAPIPPNDAERLQALYDLLLLDTPPEERFDRIVAFAASEFDMPIAHLTLVDEQRQWFKSKVGIDVCETSRAESFCGHLVAAGDELIVEDATQDKRFFDNPMVTGSMGIRFYAGMPLTLPSGHVVGALCVLDRKPRELDAVDRVVLRKLRDLAVKELLERDTNAQ